MGCAPSNGKPGDEPEGPKSPSGKAAKKKQECEPNAAAGASSSSSASKKDAPPEQLPVEHFVENVPGNPDQVGGHAGSFKKSTRGVLYKPCNDQELAMYTYLRAQYKDLAGHFVPNFEGVAFLELLEEQPEGGDLTAFKVELHPYNAGTNVSPDVYLSSLPTQGDRYLVMQDLCQGLKKPCVMDLKIGTVLHDHKASADKAARMKAKADETTSTDTGVQMCGYKRWNAKSQEYIKLEHAEYRQLTSQQLPHSVAEFYHNGDKVRQDVAQAHLDAVRELLPLMQQAESKLRLWGSSLLFIYDGEEGEGAGAPSVKMIDFAHTFRVEELGDRLPELPDGYLFGLNSVEEWLASIAASGSAPAAAAAAASSSSSAGAHEQQQPPTDAPAEAAPAEAAPAQAAPPAESAPAQ